MFKRNAIAVAVFLCLLGVSTAKAQQRDDRQRDPISIIVKSIHRYFPWLSHLPTDDGIIIPRP